MADLGIDCACFGEDGGPAGEGGLMSCCKGGLRGEGKDVVGDSCTFFGGPALLGIVFNT